MHLHEHLLFELLGQNPQSLSQIWEASRSLFGLAAQEGKKLPGSWVFALGQLGVWTCAIYSPSLGSSVQLPPDSCFAFCRLSALSGRRRPSVWRASLENPESRSAR